MPTREQMLGLLQRLESLNASQFSSVVLGLGVKPSHLPGEHAAPSERAHALLRLTAQRGDHGVDALAQCLDAVSLLAPAGPASPMVKPGGADSPSRPGAGTTAVAQQLRVLFLTANPPDTTRMALGEELHQIDTAIRLSEGRDRFVISYAHEVRARKLAQTLQRYTPDVVHFSGHGTERGELLLSDDQGRAVPVRPGDVAEIFRLCSGDAPIRCVVLNACYSEVLARALEGVVDCVIGVPNALRDATAIAFASTFYEGLGFGRGLDTAYQLACVSAMGRRPDEMPVLHVRPGLAAERLRVLGPLRDQQNR